MKVTTPLIKAFVIFPMNVMGVIPGFLLWSSREGGIFEKYPLNFDLIRSFPGGLLIGAGASLCWISVSLFSEYGGGGTPAPYDPPKIFCGAWRIYTCKKPYDDRSNSGFIGRGDALWVFTCFYLGPYFFPSVSGFNTFLGRTPIWKTGLEKPIWNTNAKSQDGFLN